MASAIAQLEKQGDSSAGNVVSGEGQPLPDLLDGKVSAQQSDSSTSFQNDANMKLSVVGKGGQRITILTLDPTQSAEGKAIFDKVQQLSSGQNGEIDAKALLKAVTTQEELKETVNRQKKIIGKLILGFVVAAVCLFAVTLCSSLLSGNLVKELYLGPSSSDDQAPGDTRRLQDASGNVVATAIAQDELDVADISAMSVEDLSSLNDITLEAHGVMRYYKVNSVAKRCGVVQVQAESGVTIFFDDIYVSILGLRGEREVLTLRPKAHCDEAGCRMLSKKGKNLVKCYTWSGRMIAGEECFVRGTVFIYCRAKRCNTWRKRRLQGGLDRTAEWEAEATVGNDVMLEPRVRQLHASAASPEHSTIQLQCSDTLEDVLDHMCAIGTNYSVQCPNDCRCESRVERIYGCNPYTADSSICCAALLDGVQHPAAFLINAGGAQENFDACPLTDAAPNSSIFQDARKVLSQSAGPYPRSFRVLGNGNAEALSVLSMDGLGHSVDRLSGAMDEVDDSMRQAANEIETTYSIAQNISKAIMVLLEVAELTKKNLTSQ